MAEVVGLVSTIVRCIDYSSKILSQLKEFESTANYVPKAFQDITVQLLLLNDTLRLTKEHAVGGHDSQETIRVLFPVISGYISQLELLHEILKKTLPNRDESSWKRGMKAFSSVGQEKKVQQIIATLRGYTQTLAYHYAITTSWNPEPKAIRSVFLVPFSRDSEFVGREDIINEIQQKLRTQPRVALAGIGGVGKSQIAIEYCYRYRSTHPEDHVFWVHAGSMARFEQGYKEIAGKLSLPGWDDPNVKTLQLVSEWLSDEGSGHWLLVLDNADDMETPPGTEFDTLSSGSQSTAPLVKYLPRSSNGSVIITTRDRRIGEMLSNGKEPIMIPSLTVVEAEAMLRSRVPQETWSEADSSELVNALELQPLAITQAAAFIVENQITVADFLQMLANDDSDMINLLSEDLQDPRREREALNSITRTWKLSFDLVRNQRPRAAEILSLMAVLDRQGIPRTLLRRDGESEIEFITALGTLKAFSLITEDRGATFEMSRLVQLSTRNWLELQGVQKMWQEQALERLAHTFPVGDYENWEDCRTLLPHAQTVIGYCFSSNSCLLQRATLLHNVARYNETQGRYDIAYKQYMEGLAVREQLRGPEHLETLVSLNSLALVLRSLGKYDAAEEMNRRALDGYERVLGPDHPSTLSSISNLALLLQDQGRFGDAETLDRQVLEGYKKALGSSHPDTLSSIGNMVDVLQAQGKYEEAKAMNRLLIQQMEKVLGPEHRDTLSRLSNLASILQAEGKYEAAERASRQVLERMEKVLGSEHLDTLKCVSDLAVVLASQGKLAEAEEMTRRALERGEKELGKEHPLMLTSTGNMVDVLRAQGRYEEAEAMSRLLIQRMEKVLGAEHRDTLLSTSNLASILQSEGAYETAEGMSRQVLERMEKELGPQHLDTLKCVSNLAVVLASQGKLTEAEEMTRRALVGREKELGKEHPLTLTSVNNLAVVLEDRGKYEAAEEMNRRALEASENVLGKENLGTLASVSNLARVLQSQGNYGAAEQMNRRALDGYRKVLGSEHPDTLMSFSKLAKIVREQGRWREAIVLQLQVMEMMTRVLGETHPSTLESMADTAKTYQEQGRWKEAEGLQMQVIETKKRILGEEHPSTLESIADLTRTYQEQGQWGKAGILPELVETMKKVLGAEHPSTLGSATRLARIYQKQSRWGDSQVLLIEVTEAMKRVLGAEHPSTLEAMADLARTFQEQGRYSKATELQEEVIETMRSVLGEGHPFTRKLMANLAISYSCQGLWGRAERLELQVMNVRLEHLGADHPDTLDSAVRVIETALKTGQKESSDPSLKFSLDGVIQLLEEYLKPRSDFHDGQDRSLAIRISDVLSEAYIMQERIRDSEEMSRASVVSRLESESLNDCCFEFRRMNNGQLHNKRYSSEDVLGEIISGPLTGEQEVAQRIFFLAQDVKSRIPLLDKLSSNISDSELKDAFQKGPEQYRDIRWKWTREQQYKAGVSYSSILPSHEDVETSGKEGRLRGTLRHKYPLVKKTDFHERAFLVNFEDLTVSWMMRRAATADADKHDSHGASDTISTYYLKTTDIFSCGRARTFPHTAIEIVISHFNTLHACWSSILTAAESHSIHTNEILLEKRGRDKTLIGYLLKDSSLWNEFEASLRAQVECSSKIKDLISGKNCVLRPEASRRLARRDISSGLIRRVSEVHKALLAVQEDISEKLVKRTQQQILLTKEFNLVSIHEAQQSVLMAMSMKRLTWITVDKLLEKYIWEKIEKRRKILDEEKAIGNIRQSNETGSTRSLVDRVLGKFGYSTSRKKAHRE